jgi:hypothetical protein
MLRQWVTVGQRHSLTTLTWIPQQSGPPIWHHLDRSWQHTDSAPPFTLNPGPSDVSRGRSKRTSAINTFTPDPIHIKLYMIWFDVYAGNAIQYGDNVLIAAVFFDMLHSSLVEIMQRDE